MSEGVQRVVVIQDVSRDMSPIAIRLVLNGFSLKPGDAIILFGVLHQVNNPSTLSFTEVGYRFKVDSKSMFGANPKFIEEEVSRKTEEYVNNVEILEIAKQCEMEQIEFRVEVRAGSTPKELALKAAKIFRATWVILDRQMKKDKRYFMDKLPCGISRMKRNNTIEQLRGSKTRENIKVNEKEEERVPYDEMIPGSPKRRRSARKPPAPPSTGAVREQQFNHGEEITHENHRRSDSFSKSASTSQFMMTTASSSTSTTGYHEHDTSSSTSKTAKHAYMNFQGKENTANTQQATAGKHSLAENNKFEQKEREAESLNEQQRRQKNIDNWMGESPTDELGDFGLARTQHEDSEPSLETRVVGTLGYLAPEYAECGKVSTKTDVYAFGVVLLQLITGLKTTDKILGGKSLVGWARPLLKERNYPDLIDQRILESHDVHQLFWMVRVAEKCLSKDPQKRLTMDKVVYALNYIIESNSTCSLGELTPAKSDSPSSVQDSYESYDDTTSFTIETFSPGFPTDTTSTSSTSPRLPPSPPINFRHHLHY
ncbi:hypothetical protein Peur_056625 [Populus x canadensis]